MMQFLCQINNECQSERGGSYLCERVSATGHRVETRAFSEGGMFVTGTGHRVGSQGFVIYLQGLLSLLQ